MRLVDTPMVELVDPDILELVEELKELRSGDFYCLRVSPLLYFLQCFFLPGDQSRFVPIRLHQLLAQRWLLSNVSDTSGTYIYVMYRELALGHKDSAENPKIYSALNSLLKPLCVPHIRKKSANKRPHATAQSRRA